MIPHKTAPATCSRRLRLPLAVLLVLAAGGLLIGQPQAARATTGDFEIQGPGGRRWGRVPGAGGLQTCDSTNNCTGGLTQPKTVATRL